MMGSLGWSDSFSKGLIDIKKYIDDGINDSDKIEDKFKLENEGSKNYSLGIYYALKNISFDELFDAVIDGRLFEILPENKLFDKNNLQNRNKVNIELFAANIIKDNLKDNSLLMKNKDRIKQFIERSKDNEFYPIVRILKGIYVNNFAHSDLETYRAITTEWRLATELDVKDIFINKKDIVYSDILMDDPPYTEEDLSYTTSIIILNAATQNKERTRQLLEGKTSTDDENNFVGEIIYEKLEDKNLFSYGSLDKIILNIGKKSWQVIMTLTIS